MFRQIYGLLPFTSGRILWVSPAASYTVNGRTYDASDNNDGLSATRALRTPNRAWATAVSGDTIVLLPGTHTLTSSIAANVSGVTMMGVPGGPPNSLRPRTVVTGATGDQLVNVTAAEIKIAYLTFQPDTAQTAVDLTSGAPRCHFTHCAFDMSAQTASTSTKGIATLSNATYLLVEHCSFMVIGAQGPAIDTTGTGRVIVRDVTLSLISGTWAVAIQLGASSIATLFQRVLMLDNAGTITAGIDGTGVTATNAVTVLDCRFGVGVTVPVEGFDANECVLAENYQAAAGGGSGGALITAIT